MKWLPALYRKPTGRVWNLTPVLDSLIDPTDSVLACHFVDYHAVSAYYLFEIVKVHQFKYRFSISQIRRKPLRRLHPLRPRTWRTDMPLLQVPFDAPDEDQFEEMNFFFARHALAGVAVDPVNHHWSTQIHWNGVVEERATLLWRDYTRP